VLSAAQRDAAALRRYVLSITEVISLVTFPATVGLALVAPDIVKLALGDRWLAVVAPLRLLALYTGVRSVLPLLSQVLAMTGENARVMRISIVAAVLMPIAFVFASRWGIAGIAAGWIFAHPIIVVFPSARAAFRRAEMTTGQYLRALAPALSGVLVMSGAVIAVHLVLPVRVGPAGSLLIGASLGAVMYVGTVLVFFRERVSTLVRFAQSHLRPAPSA
jgi:O-antigen/teichoic acid export membrane protein